jgi:hypothetical protein
VVDFLNLSFSEGSRALPSRHSLGDWGGFSGNGQGLGGVDAEKGHDNEGQSGLWPKSFILFEGSSIGTCDDGGVSTSRG